MHDAGQSSAQDLLNGLSTFKQNWPGGWSWDARLDCISSSFRSEDEGLAESVIKPVFPTAWKDVTLRQSPLVVQQLAERCGGLRSDQSMYCSQAAGGLFLFGLWWPWGDDVTLSFRIGLGGQARERDIAKLRDVFSVEIY